MANERWQRLEALFHRAVDLDPNARRALLDAECADDPSLREEVERLLAGDTTGDDPLSRLEAHTRTVGPDPLLSTILGAYRLTGELAAGGMGVVYRGERIDGMFEQQVAIKLIRTDCASSSMLRRFEFERRMLAALQHPGIARLYDGGTTPAGSPYFVMELVRGVAIDRHCEMERLPLVARLRLFLQVCRIVQFAHQKLVVHCDLKPANILIDERGAPRLLDFGIARLLEDEPETRPTATSHTLGRLLTPEYASPEHLAGERITTAHDVYSLGVILYELATERRPFQQVTRSVADWERLVREQVPERPSTRVVRREADFDPKAVATRFRSTPGGLRRHLRGDLDRIVLMALRKEPERRYASVQEFADDLERHLAGLPVRARAPSLTYRASRFVRRNRTLVGAGAVALTALLYGFFAARRGEQRAMAEAQHAQMEADSFQSLAGFLMDAFLPTQPAQDAAFQERARQQILTQARRVERQYGEDHHMRANLLDALGHVALRLDLPNEGEQLLEQARSLRLAAFGDQSIEYALSLRSLGQLRYQTGHYAEAVRQLEAALALHRALPASVHSDIAAIANDLAACLRNLGRDAEAEALHREALNHRRAQRLTLPVAESLNNLAGVHLGRGEYATAIDELQEALAIRSATLGNDHELTLQTTSNLASVLWRHGDRNAARELMQHAEAGYRALGGDGESGLGLVYANLAAMQLEVADLDGAAASLERARTLQVRRLGRDHPQVATTLTRLAMLHHRRNQNELAQQQWQEVLRIRRLPEAPPHELTDALYGFGVFQFAIGATARAIELATEAISLQHHAAVADAAGTALAGLGRAELLLGRCLLQTGQREAAREHLAEAVRQLDASPTATIDERASARQLLSNAER